MTKNIEPQDGMRVWLFGDKFRPRTLRRDAVTGEWTAVNDAGRLSCVFGSEKTVREWLRAGIYVPIRDTKPVEPEFEDGPGFAGFAERNATPTHDAVAHPKHYTAHPSGVECIQITEHMGFNLGNAVKYLWRCDLKQDAIEDLKKARWYIDREIEKREREKV